ncbi:MAG: phosphoglycerate dehydrogenase [Chloroflexi bacterium]|nr:phosphoglycerate dehydrogenase [Chloroflexota bacterium]
MTRKHVLVTEAIAEQGLQQLQQACEVTVLLNPSPSELVAAIGDYHGLIVRSGTRVTEEVLSAAKKLEVVGRAGTGVDNIDLDAATRRGIVVVNAPTSNTIAVAEHTMALMLSLARHIPQANQMMHCGRWEKRALMGTELRGKTLGLVGLGRVGTAVAVRAQAFEMRVVAHDPFISPERAEQLNVQLMGLDELLCVSDYVSLHAPATERTRGMIGARELALMKPNAYLINCARGELIREEALIEALRHGRIAGAALDVYPDEPRVSPALCEIANVILTPHLGASTEEAQSGAALEVVQQVIDVLAGRPPRYPVNLAAVSPEEMAYLRPYLDLATLMGRFYAQFAENNLKYLELSYAGDVGRRDTSLITAAALAGLLSEAGESSVNLVNARLVAEERGLIVSETRIPHDQVYSDLVTLKAQTTRRERVLSGTVMRGQPHIVRIDNFWLDFVPTGSLLVEEHTDEPGLVGKIGTLLGEAGVSISFVQLGREERGGAGIMVFGLDDPLSEETLAAVARTLGIQSARHIRL